MYLTCNRYIRKNTSIVHAASILATAPTEHDYLRSSNSTAPHVVLKQVGAEDVDGTSRLCRALQQVRRGFAGLLAPFVDRFGTCLQDLLRVWMDLWRH